MIYYTDPTLTLGDVLDVLLSVPDNHYDAFLCDPPYLLEFMGKEFDRQHRSMSGENDGQRMYQWHLRWCREVFRVLKPGAFILAFGGTRTSHRLACALEDVGFEICDEIGVLGKMLWVQGQGFPKGHDLEKAIRKKALQAAEHDLRFVLCTYLSSPIYACSECGQVLLKIVQKHGTPEQGEERPESEIAGKEQSSLERWSDLETPERELFRCKVCTMSHGILADGSERRLCNGAQIKDGEEVEKTAKEDRSSSSQRSQSKKQSTEQLDAVSLERRAQEFRGYNPALKPAHEPLILAMKPCIRTFAENAIENGIAGLNIDGCRIGTEERTYSSGTPGANSLRLRGEDGRDAQRGREYAEMNKGRPPVTVSGRWPANLILSHHESCLESECHPLCPVRLLDEQSGVLQSRGNKSASSDLSENLVYGKHTEHSSGPEYNHGGSGGASRFFYCAKVSTRERNIGGVECKHPTLKPIDLCRYLSTLLLPPPHSNSSPRRMLIPFSGAGSEVTGAQLAGWDYVHGIEQDPEYYLSSLYRTKGAIFSMSSVSRDKVVHSSLSEVKRLGLDAEFPGFPASIGVIIRRKHFGGHLIESHVPKLSSLVSGETLECDADDLDTRLRLDLYTCAGDCRELAADLIRHAERLESRAKEEKLIDDSENVEDVIPSHPVSVSREIPSPSRPSNPLDLDIFS